MILHHFDASPFSEKIRLILGYKNLAWSSVKVPRIMPKPDLMPLTGGYRRTPVLQIGRDIYADTRLIARVIDTRFPSPALIPETTAASVAAFEMLGDQRLFLAAIPILLSPAGRADLEARLGRDGLADFRADRRALFANGALGAPDDQFSRAHLGPAMRALDSQLADRPFLLGEAPTLADFAVYHPVWYIRGNAGVAATLDGYPNLLRWAERMAAFGHGHPETMSPKKALAEAQVSDVAADSRLEVDVDTGLVAGQKVAVSATDYGSDRIYGQLMHLDSEWVTIQREQPEIGVLRNHFPVQGFRLDAVDEDGQPTAAAGTIY